MIRPDRTMKPGACFYEARLDRDRIVVSEYRALGQYGGGGVPLLADGTLGQRFYATQRFSVGDLGSGQPRRRLTVQTRTLPGRPTTAADAVLALVNERAEHAARVKKQADRCQAQAARVGAAAAAWAAQEAA